MFSFDHESLPKHVGTSGIQTLNDGNGYLPNFYGVLLKKKTTRILNLVAPTVVKLQ